MPSPPRPGPARRAAVPRVRAIPVLGLFKPPPARARRHVSSLWRLYALGCSRTRSPPDRLHHPRRNCPGPTSTSPGPRTRPIITITADPRPRRTARRASQDLPPLQDGDGRCEPARAAGPDRTRDYGLLSLRGVLTRRQSGRQEGLVASKTVSRHQSDRKKGPESPVNCLGVPRRDGLHAGVG